MSKGNSTSSDSSQVSGDPASQRVAQEGGASGSDDVSEVSFDSGGEGHPEGVGRRGDGYIDVTPDGEEETPLPTHTPAQVLANNYRWNKLEDDLQHNIFLFIENAIAQGNQERNIDEAVAERYKDQYIKSLEAEQEKEEQNPTRRETSLDRFAKEAAYAFALERENGEKHLQDYLRDDYIRFVQRTALNIQRLYRGHLGRKEAKKKRLKAEEQVQDSTNSADESAKKDAAATVIEAGVRGFLVRRALVDVREQFKEFKLRREQELEEKVLIAQSAVRRFLARKRLEKLREEKEEELKEKRLQKKKEADAESIASEGPDQDRDLKKSKKGDGDTDSTASNDEGLGPDVEDGDAGAAANPTNNTDTTRALNLNDQDEQDLAASLKLNHALLEDALQKMSSTAKGRLSRGQYNQEVKYESDKFKYRPKIVNGKLTYDNLVDERDGKAISDRSLQTRWMQQIVGYNELPIEGVAGDDAKHHIEQDQYGNTVAQYHGVRGLSELHQQARNAAVHYAGNSLKAGEFFVVSAKVIKYDGDRDFNCEITASSQGVTLAFLEKENSTAEKIADFVKNHGEELMHKAISMHGIFPVLLEGIQDPEEKKAAIARNAEFEKKRPAIEQTVRALARESVIEQTRLEMQRNFRQQQAGLPKQADYDALKDDAGIFHRGAFEKAIQKLRNEPDPVFTGSGLAFSQGENDEVVKVSFVANTRGDADPSKTTAPSMTKAYVYIPGTDECYVEVQVATHPEQYLTYYKNGELITNEKFNKGDVVISTGAIHRYVKNAQGGGSYEAISTKKPLINRIYGQSKLEKKFGEDRAKEITSKVNRMVIQGSSQIDGARGFALEGKGFSVRRQLQSVQTIDEKQESAQFTRLLPKLEDIKDARRIGVGNYPTVMETPWDKTEIYFKCPLLQKPKSKGGGGFYDKGSLGDALVERRENAMVRMCMATQEGFVTLNDGSQKFVKVGEVYRHPIPYDGAKKMITNPFSTMGDGLGADFMMALQNVEFAYKIADEKTQMEEKLRELLENCSGDQREMAEINTILDNYCQIQFGPVKKDLIDINAANPITGDTALHLAIKRGLFEIDETTGGLKADCVVAKLLAKGADPMQRNFQIDESLAESALSNSRFDTINTIANAVNKAALKAVNKFGTVANAVNQAAHHYRVATGQHPDSSPFLAKNSGLNAAGLAITKGHFTLANNLLQDERAVVDKAFADLKNKLTALKQEIPEIQNAGEALKSDLEKILQEKEGLDPNLAREIKRMKEKLSPVRRLQDFDSSNYYNEFINSASEIDPDIAALKKELKSLEARYAKESSTDKKSLTSRMEALRKMQIELQEVDRKYQSKEDLALDDMRVAVSMLNAAKARKEGFYKDPEVEAKMARNAAMAAAVSGPVVVPPPVVQSPGAAPGKPLVASNLRKLLLGVNVEKGR